MAEDNIILCKRFTENNVDHSDVLSSYPGCEFALVCTEHNPAQTIKWICIRGKSEFNSRIHYFQIDSRPLSYTFKSTSAKESSGNVVDFKVLKRMDNI